MYTRDVLKHGVFDLIGDTVFEIDNAYFAHIRHSVETLVKRTLSRHKGDTILEIGPSTNKERRLAATCETVDIVDGNDTTYVADLTRENDLPKNHFDAVYCLEVLEHTYEPWEMIKQMHALLKDGGHLYISVPFQFRLHGPLPDCYRISEYGMRYLLEKNGFDILLFEALVDESRPAFPIHYALECIKKKASS